MTAYTISHTRLGEKPFWYQLEQQGDLETACRRARQYALDNGGYISVKDAQGRVVFGSNPVDLNSSIASGLNRHFRVQS